MIDPEKCKVILRLHSLGHSSRQIAKLVEVDRKTVRRIIKGDSSDRDSPGRSRKGLEEDLLRRLYVECNGWNQRIWEKLTEEEGYDISYSTVCRRIRELELGVLPKKRSAEIIAEPGEEMQHDTTIYQVKVAGVKVKIVCSILYYRYSKVFYIKMYRRFDRFAMKCFFHEALVHLGYCAQVCVIDNTNLARLRGTGERALMVPEMESFSSAYGFRFLCHEIGHANRKGGCERAFRSTETGFLPGRTFSNLDDLNQQAYEWAYDKKLKKVDRRSGRVPLDAFETEKEYLLKVSPEHPAPYQAHHRKPDPYGYISFSGNYYWLPGTRLDEVKILEFRERIDIYRKAEFIRSYAKPSSDLKNQIFRPSDWTGRPYEPKSRKSTDQDEAYLRAKGGVMEKYLDYVLSENGTCRRRVLRELESLSKVIVSGILDKALERALRYRITDMQTLRSIIHLLMRHNDSPIPEALIDPDMGQRPAYQEGRLSDMPDFTIYDSLMEDDDERKDGDDDHGAEPQGMDP